MSKPKSRRIASSRGPAALPLHPAAEQALVAVGSVADELAKLNASMDKLLDRCRRNYQPGTGLVGLALLVPPHHQLKNDRQISIDGIAVAAGLSRCPFVLQSQQVA